MLLIIDSVATFKKLYLSNRHMLIRRGYDLRLTIIYPLSHA